MTEDPNKADRSDVVPDEQLRMAKRFCRWVEASGLGTKQVSQLLGVTESAVGRWKSGRFTPELAKRRSWEMTGVCPAHDIWDERPNHLDEPDSLEGA
jgi:ribosome-binding protein aMBF1 (putative translation factor)